jgi:hypothetical protein
MSKYTKYKEAITKNEGSKQALAATIRSKYNKAIISSDTKKQEAVVRDNGIRVKALSDLTKENQ